MNDVITSFDSGCTCFLKLAVAAFLLGVLYLCVALGKCLKPDPRQAPVINANPKGLMPVARALIAKPIVEPVVETEPEVVQPLQIECGRCGFAITTSPVRMVAEPEPAEIYQCANCKAHVSVSV